MTIDLRKLQESVAGFSGKFSFQEEHDVDQGAHFGEHWVHDIVTFPDRLIFMPNESRRDHADDEDNLYVISDCVEQHVAEPLTEMLNATPELLRVYEAALEFEAAYSADATDGQHATRDMTELRARNKLLKAVREVK